MHQTMDDIQQNVPVMKTGNTTAWVSLNWLRFESKSVILGMQEWRGLS
jgi:hypothetical protein